MAKTTTYIARVGLNYPTAKGEVRIEAGEKITDLPAKSAAWLRDQGLIESADGKNADPVEGSDD
jgi:hypothetical protein